MEGKILIEIKDRSDEGNIHIIGDQFMIMGLMVIACGRNPMFEESLHKVSKIMSNPESRKKMLEEV